ncbi:hypothetical protein L226DRAFT_538962 [Lentinus tigrinus ALCF2SS1-7]|uniref:ZZ-type domain-containing protein n=1 Tax=Lentinus tigrinus ALCF2SS1-6 TaxID=1328759 RepID=A0A5C2RU46_9APHY|nr:hypothetical protein L227DRAFT_579958 [Lentinus tigrinus ALCF2SS1-6]RPD70316.1 hypothetical protein L226DRAFT_538962 [Lentinus tigrinus ALCF2SS1-7]
MSPRNDGKPGIVVEGIGEDKFAEALRAMAEVTSKPNVTKNHTVDIEGAVDTVFMAVDALASLHPAISAIKVPLIIIKNCAINRENRSRIALMKLKMAEMLCALFEIRFIEVDEERIVDVGHGQVERFSGALTLLCKEISNTLVKVGNLVERYAKERSLRRVIWAADWKQQIKECCDECDSNKQSIGYRIKVFTARQVHDISKTLAEIKVSTEIISKQFDPTQQKERQLYDEIKKRGLEGRLDRLTDEELIDLANKAGESGENKPNRQELRDLRVSVKELLNSSLRGFEIRLDMHTKQLDRALYRLKKLPTDAQLYKRIEDPDIQKLWRDWKWSGSVEASTFTLNLYDYFIDLTREARRQAALSQYTLQPGPLTIQTSLVVQQSPISPVSDVGEDDLGDEQCTTGADTLEFYWCTRYFSFRNMSIFMEAMDADGNGLIKIKEVNEFTRAKPPTLSLMEWIAYRSYGWLIASYLYKLRIQFMIEVMLAIDYAPQNCSTVAGYFIQVPNILNLLSTIQTPVLEDSSLVKVVHTVMSHQEKQLEDVLDSLKYNVTEDGITLLSSVNGAEGFEMGSELESFLLPTLFLLLSRHYELLKLSAKYVLNEDEIGRNAATSIRVIMNAVEDRVKSLADYFRKMQLDVRQKFDSFANGMYQGIYRIQTSAMSFTQIQDEATVPQNTLQWLNYLLKSYDCQENKLYTELNTSSSALRPELAHYGRLPIFDTVPSDAIPRPAQDDCLRHDDYVSLVRFREQYGVEFVRSWNLEMDAERPRASLASANISHNFVGCDGCGSAVTGIRYKCVQCENFDYCDTCHANPPPIPPDNSILSLHNATHDYLAQNQDTPTSILDMMRRGLASHERVVVIALLTLSILEAHGKAGDLATLIHFCFDPVEDVRPEGAERAEAFLDSLGEEGQLCKESLLCLKLYRNTQGHYASCDGCHGSIQGNRFECIDCFDFDFCQECYDTRAYRESIGGHEVTHRFALVQYPIPWMLIRRLLACTAGKDSGTWTKETLQEWRNNLIFLRSTDSSAEPEYYDSEDDDEPDHDIAPNDDTVQGEAGGTADKEASQSNGGMTTVNEGSQCGDENAPTPNGNDTDWDGNDPNEVQHTDDKQAILSVEVEVSNELQGDAGAESRTCDGSCGKPITGHTYRCLLCEVLYKTVSRNCALALF